MVMEQIICTSVTLAKAGGPLEEAVYGRRVLPLTSRTPSSNILMQPTAFVATF